MPDDVLLDCPAPGERATERRDEPDAREVCERAQAVMDELDALLRRRWDDSRPGEVGK